MVAFIAPATLAAQLKARQAPLLLDVRPPAEQAAWHIEGSVNIPLAALPQRLGEVPRDQNIITICAHGVRSQQAAAFLVQHGYQACVLEGGMAAWNRVYDCVPVALKGATLVQVRRLGKKCLSYFIASNSVAAVIDPSIHTGEYLRLAHQHRARIRFVIDTHQHADHVSGARLLAHATGAQLYLNPHDEYHGIDFIPIADGDVIAIGTAVLTALHTPGHTAGSTSFALEDVLFTGDTLFVDGIARPDLHNNAAAYAHDLYRTYRKLCTRDGGTRILPAHTSTAIVFDHPIAAPLDDIRRRFPVIDAAEQAFIRAAARVPPKPPHFLDILAINRGDIALTEDAEQLEEGPNRCVLPTG